MNFLDLLGTQLLIFDGAMGTMLQEAGLQPGETPDTWNALRPDVVRDIHAAYLAAGSNIIMTNTFGCTRARLEGSGYSAGELAAAGATIAREAVAQSTGAQPKFVALDIGPSGKLLAPLGELLFEDAVSMFREPVLAGAEAGADLIIVETMSDPYELKAAVLAAKESTRLPVLATVVMDPNGKMLTGGDLDSVVALLEGLRVDALGLNCGLGPSQMLSLLKHLRKITSLPIVLNPNAGLPRQQDGEAVYDVGPEEFGWMMRRAVEGGAHVIGGCCGTTPKHIEAVVSLCADAPLLPPEEAPHTVASSFRKAVYFGDTPVRIGARTNPACNTALLEGDIENVVDEALSQQDLGADVLHIATGQINRDEAAFLQALVQEVQRFVPLPLLLEAKSPAALASAMRLYNGKPIVSAVTGKQADMDDLFPLVQTYGGLLIAKTLDESGIPDSAEGRVAIAQNILAEAEKYGIPRKDILFNTLAPPIGADGQGIAVALDALHAIRKTLGAYTILELFPLTRGLPRRDLLRTGFLCMAFGAGLSAASLDLEDDVVNDAYYTALALCGGDPQCEAYIARFGEPQV